MIIKIQCFVEADCNFENMKQFTAGLHGWYRFVIFHWMCRTIARVSAVVLVCRQVLLSHFSPVCLCQGLYMVFMEL